MRLLTKEYNPTSGEIIFEGQPLAKIKNRQIHLHRRKIGVVFQDYRLVPEMNVWENIALALSILGKPQEEIERRVTDLLTLIQMTDKAFLFPSQLSGGEAQRVSIARAMAHAPSIIFADEPTGNLDKQTSLSITSLLKKINEFGTTVILATHDISVLDALANERVLQLNQGRLIKDSAPHQKPAEHKLVTEEEKLAKTKEKIAAEHTVHHTKHSDDTKQPEDQKESKPKKSFSLGSMFKKKKETNKEK